MRLNEVNVKTRNLSAPQRLIVAFMYIATISLLIRFFSGNWSFLQDGSPYSLIFLSASLLLVFGTYITEPFFTKPADTITNSVAILLALVAVNDKSNFIAYEYFFAITLGFLLFGVVTVLTVSDPAPRWQKAIYKTVTKLGSSKIAFSAMYILTLLSFFTENAAEFWALLSFLLLLLSRFVYEEFIFWASNILKDLKNEETRESIGVAIGKENPYLYRIEVDNTKKSPSSMTSRGSLVYLNAGNNSGYLGIVTNEKSLLKNKWLTVYLLEKDGRVAKYNFKNNKLSYTENLFSPDNQVYGFNVDLIPEEISKELEQERIVNNSENIVGYVASGSDISKIRFETLSDNETDELDLKEGTILEVPVGNKRCLYQVIDGQTEEENLEKHNSSGYTVGVAQKLGSYNARKRELEVVKWLPDIYTPVYSINQKKKIDSDRSIGSLPGTGIAIDLKDPSSLVTHNTAVLGILGIGKSVLTFELIQKVLSFTEARIICVDITNEYKNNLPLYTDLKITSDDENAFNSINSKADFIYTEGTGDYAKKDPNRSGNIDEYRKAIRKDLLSFLFDSSEVPDNKEFTDNRVRIYNPDYHKVTKGEKMGIHVLTPELTQAEKVRIISEETFRILMEMGVSDNKEARILLVFEEAHSLVPEWNSTANDGDQSAVNGTAKVILQGRKYGLGSLVVTQRTANISKSILNQCNTIFALRVFDDTGKQFLENYVGRDYSNALPTLEERYSVCVGKAMSLKQPVIVRLNDMKSIQIEKE